MKIQVFHSKSGGPAVFMKRLIDYLVNHFDAHIVNNKPDVYFSAVWRGSPPKGVKTVHRVDGCYFNKLQDHFKGLNREIKRIIKLSDGVVFQSNFSYKICQGILGVIPKKYSIIYNAIDQSECGKIEPLNHSFSSIFVASAIWRPLKRPNSIVRAFLDAKLDNSALFMVGKTNKPIKAANVFWTGGMSSSSVYKYYKSCNALVHISRLDACPNSVVEALSFGKPVICNNAGGSPELVGKDGIIVQIDPVDNYKAFEMKKVDNIKTKPLSDAIRKCVSMKWEINRPDLDMSYCAKKYYDFFLDVLSV